MAKSASQKNRDARKAAEQRSAVTGLKPETQAVIADNKRAREIRQNQRAAARAIPKTPEARRIQNAAMTRRDVANGTLPSSWTTPQERALRANPEAAKRTEKVANRMLADPNATAKRLEAVQRGATRAARIKATKTGLAIAAGTAAVAALTAMTSGKAKAAEPAKAERPKREFTTAEVSRAANAAATAGGGAAALHAGTKVGGKLGLALKVAGTAATLVGTAGLANVVGGSGQAKAAEPAKPSGDTYERKYTSGPKAGTTETVRKRGRVND